MLCPQCFTTWDDPEDYLKHLEAHGLDPWKCQQLQRDLTTAMTNGGHRPNEACQCRMWGSRFECELRIYKAR